MNRLLKDIVNTFRVSSHENKIVELIKSELKDVQCEIREDKVKNLIVNIGQGSEKVMITTHIDEVGLMVSYIEDNGYARVVNIGDIKSENFVGRKAEFNNGATGIILSSKDNGSIDDLFIDFGTTSKEETLKLIKEADSCKAEGQYINLENNKSAQGISSAANICAMINVIKELEDANKEYYFAFTSQGKLGGRGAKVATFEIKPDKAFVISSEETGDRPGGSSTVSLGKGPVLILKDSGLIISEEMKNIVEEAAKLAEVDMQITLGKDRNEGSIIHKELGGIDTAVISIPVRYKNSMLETVTDKDINSLKKLLLEIIK